LGDEILDEMAGVIVRELVGEGNHSRFACARYVEEEFIGYIGLVLVLGDRDDGEIVETSIRKVDKESKVDVLLLGVVPRRWDLKFL